MLDLGVTAELAVMEDWAKGFWTDPMVDIHTHLREATNPSIMRSLIDYSIAGGAEYVGGQPNTSKGLRKACDVVDYTATARSLVPEGKKLGFIPYLMVNEETTNEDIDEAIAAGIFDGKVYPLFRTTKSEYGVFNYGRLIPVIKHCGKVGFRVHMHPEHPRMTYGHREAEMAFLPIVYLFLEETDATIFWEHGSTGDCIPHWKEMAKTGRFFLTICAHHLATNEDDVRGDVSATVNPSIKTEADRLALIRLVTENHPWVMAISDSAYHPLEFKHVFSGKCSCGALTAPYLMPIFAHALNDLVQTQNGREVFKRFTSGNARAKFGLPPASGQILLVQEPWKIPRTYPVGDETGLPFWGQKELLWQIKQRRSQ